MVPAGPFSPLHVEEPRQRRRVDARRLLRQFYRQRGVNQVERDTMT